MENYNMKSTFFAIAAALSMAAASPVFAQSLEVQGTYSDNVSGGGDSKAVLVEYTDNLVGAFDWNVQLETGQRNTEGSVATTVAVGVSRPFTVYGFDVRPSVEVGERFTTGENSGFWGAGVDVERVVYGDLSGLVGYRHREGFGDSNVREDRVEVGGRYKVSDDLKVGVSYLRTDGTTDSDAVAVSLVKTF
jgi:hypothetical protein